MADILHFPPPPPDAIHARRDLDVKVWHDPHNNAVIVDFGVLLQRVGMTAESARVLAAGLLDQANRLEAAERSDE